MSKTLKTILVLVVLAIVIILLLGFGQKNNPKNGNNKGEQTGNKPVTYSLSGKVSAISGHTYTLLMSDGKTSKLFRALDNTEINRRVVAKGVITLTSVKLDQLKVGSEVVLYNSTNPSNQNELVDITRVEIIK